MINILCKIGLHKWRKVESTETTLMKLMINILNARNERVPNLNGKERICDKFGIDRHFASIGYDISDKVCIRSGCGCCQHIIKREINDLIKMRNFVAKLEIQNAVNNRLVEKIYKGCK